MSIEMAETRGHATLRPWRVALLVNTDSTEDVRAAIAHLSSVWGGFYMPIFDVRTAVGELERLGELYDVDSLYAADAEGALGELLRRPGWAWRGRGPAGPFSGDHGFRHGLLPIRALVGRTTDLIQPTWASDQLELPLAATWGLIDEVDISFTHGLGSGKPTLARYEDIYAFRAPGTPIVGIARATRQHVRPTMADRHDGSLAVYVVRPDHPRDVVEFWNIRSSGEVVVCVPADADELLLRILLSPLHARHVNEDDDSAHGHMTVWGLEDASREVASAIQATAVSKGRKVLPMSRAQSPLRAFPGLRTSFRRSFRVDSPPDGRWVDVALPSLPLLDDSESYSPGIVAAEVEMLGVRNLDPRLTASIPPFRRHSALLTMHPVVESFDHARSTSSGLALGIQAHRDRVPVPFAFNLDVMRLLFDDEATKTKQSDLGKFQSRAAEKLGGPFSGALNEPAVRAVIALAARKAAPVPLQHLYQEAERTRGRWPDPLWDSHTSPREYARNVVNFLFYSGILVPTFRVHCSHCRVESYIPAGDLSETLQCEFCQQNFKLALSNSLTQDGAWRYRLAAHLRADQVEPLAPALATLSLMRQLRHVQEPAMSHVLGLEVRNGRQAVEVDVATFLPAPDWTAVLGEVKSSNRIDANDASNLENLRDSLLGKGVRTLIVFATLKERLTPEERTVIRQVVERASPVTLSRGTVLPNLPLVLTGPDLSHPEGSEEHPWRWDSKGYSGVFGTAITSCERNLGLKSVELSGTGGVVIEWED